MSGPGLDPPAWRCPRCGAALAAQQGWCLECGAAARTRLAPTPNWRLPLALLATVIVLAGAGLAAAFVALTEDEPSANPAGAPATAPAEPPASGG